MPSEHLVFYLDFDHRITDIVADEAADLAMPAEQQLGMDWRNIPGIPSDRLTVVSEAINRCISAQGAFISAISRPSCQAVTAIIA